MAARVFPSRSRRFRHRVWGRWGLAGVLAAVAALCAGVTVASAGSSRTATAAREAKALTQNWPAAKASLYQRGVLAAVPANPPAKPPAQVAVPVPGVPTVVIPDARQTGISHLKQAPFGSGEFAVTDSYSGTIKGRWYVAYAGTLKGNPPVAGTGGIRILSSDPAATTGHITEVGTFPALGTTSLTITAYTGNTLTLTTQSGAAMTFNLDSLTYG